MFEDDHAFGDSAAAKKAAAVINGDKVKAAEEIPEDDDIFGDSVLASSASSAMRRQGIAPAADISGDLDGVSAAGAIRVRKPRPKLDENVLCGEHGISTLYDSAKQLVASSAPDPNANPLDAANNNPDSSRIIRKRGMQSDGNAPAGRGRATRSMLDDTPGSELRSLRNVMNQYRSWANTAFPGVTFDDFLERCEKLGGSRQVRDMMDLMRYRVQHDVDANGEIQVDDSGDDSASESDDSSESSGSKQNTKSSSSAPSSSSSSALSNLTDEELKARIARNRAAALERLAKRKAEREAEAVAEMQKELEDDDDDELFASLDLDAIVQKKRQQQQLQTGSEAKALPSTSNSASQQNDEAMIELSGSDEDDGDDEVLDEMYDEMDKPAAGGNKNAKSQPSSEFEAKADSQAQSQVVSNDDESQKLSLSFETSTQSQLGVDSQAP